MDDKERRQYEAERLMGDPFLREIFAEIRERTIEDFTRMDMKELGAEEFALNAMAYRARLGVLSDIKAFLRVDATPQSQKSKTVA